MKSSLKCAFGRIGSACFVLLLSFSVALYASDDKDKKKPSSSSSHSAPPRNYSSGHSSTPSNSSTPGGSSRTPSSPTPNVTRPNNSSNPNPGNTGATGARPNVVTPSGSSNTNAPRQFGNRPATPSGNTTPAGQGNNSPRNFGNSNPNVSRPAAGNNQPRQFGGSNASVAGRNVQPAGFRGGTVVSARNGGQIVRGPNGQVREVHTPGGATIYHAPGGMRTVQVNRPGGRVVVATARGYGYVQRPLVVNNVAYVQRTYIVGGVPYARVYRPWAWGGVSFAVYSPAVFYRPAFYSWAFTPFPAPIAYGGWGWGIGTPWFGFYAGYFAPYPYYASPAFWLTDYMMAATLQNAYQQQMAAQAAAAQANYGNYPPPQGGPVALTPEVKQQIADEVRAQLAQEQAQQGMQPGAVNGPPPAFSGGAHTFVVSTGLQVNDGGPGCALTEGDVLHMDGPPPPNQQYADVVVLASKGQDCPKGARVQVGLNDLQEMQNQMRATIDQGLSDLRTKQGQNGLPQIPQSANAAPVNAPFASQMKPDPDVSAQINQATSEADRAEQDTLAAAPAAGAPAAPVNISLGMTIADVERAMGSPRDVADLGAKKIYIYPDMKITFKDGKVADVQ
jgi:hypothetical protein